MCMGGGGANFSAIVQNCWRYSAKLCDFYCYYTSFAIHFGHQEPKLLPWKPDLEIDLEHVFGQKNDQKLSKSSFVCDTA